MTHDGPVLVAGLGVTGRAVVDALLARGYEVLALDDRPTDSVVRFAEDRGIALAVAPPADEVERLVRAAARVVPAPGLPHHHPVMTAASRLGARVQSEFDLAGEWDTRPRVAVTGTDGKTTVTTLVAAMLTASGRTAMLAGNNDTPLVAAIDDPSIDVFVVEASSFRIAHSERFAPQVATWLNFAPDHLDVHPDLAAYEEAKASLFDHQGPDDVAITNADDPVVRRHAGRGRARRLTFAGAPDHGHPADFHVAEGVLVAGELGPILPVDDLPRQAPHDIANALAAAATSLSAGASADGVRTVLTEFGGLPHRVEVLGAHGGVTFVDDSKATVPHAVLAAVRSFADVVLIAGGRNKGLDLSELAAAAPHLLAVVAIGESADAVAAAFAPTDVPVIEATSMAAAVHAALDAARPGATVLLSPGCASHDWYANYAERGDDFRRIVESIGPLVPR